MAPRWPPACSRSWCSAAGCSASPRSGRQLGGAAHLVAGVRLRPAATPRQPPCRAWRRSRIWAGVLLAAMLPAHPPPVAGHRPARGLELHAGHGVLRHRLGQCAAGGLLKSTLQGSEWLTGGSFGVEASLVGDGWSCSTGGVLMLVDGGAARPHRAAVLEAQELSRARRRTWSAVPDPARLDAGFGFWGVFRAPFRRSRARRRQFGPALRAQVEHVAARVGAEEQPLARALARVSPAPARSAT